MTTNWVSNFRPQTVADYVWRDDHLKEKVTEWIREREVPHVLFVGDPGVGKTSLAFLLMRELNIPDEDVLFIPASRFRKVDDVSEAVMNFVYSYAFNDTGIKYVILDEADAMSQQAQKTLRTDMETFSKTCRFILTANHLDKMHFALLSRVQTYSFGALQHDDFIMRLVSVLQDVGVDVNDTDNLNAMIDISNRCFPDLRRSIGMLEQGTTVDANGVKRLRVPNEKVDTTKDYIAEAATFIKSGRLRDARHLIVKSAQSEDYPDIYRFMYRNLDLWGETAEQQDDALIEIRKGLVYHGQVADIEINLAATLVALSKIRMLTP